MLTSKMLNPNYKKIDIDYYAVNKKLIERSTTLKCGVLKSNTHGIKCSCSDAFKT
jgi:beta-lactamase superfamily II metal-dependent hydrolase